MKILPEHEVKELLKKNGIPTTNFRIIRRGDDIKSLGLKYPLALKVSSPKILHKTDVGAIELNIKNEEELIEKYDEMRKKFKEEIFIVEEMAPQGVEMIAGIYNDKLFKKCIMVGFGGIYTEIYNDVSFRMLPVKKEDIYDMLKDLKCYKIFEGYRKKVDKEAFVDILLKISKIGEKMKINQMDLNPIFLYEEGVKVIDAKIIMEE
ncbi:MAG: acetate--CoA ligase family protein [Thermoplasmatales archaeon]|nr:acetate--CoA ligase family protein [Thermoplasmatales archaeon]